MKQSDTLQSGDTPTILIDNCWHILMIERFKFSVMAGLIVEMLSMLFSIYNTVYWTNSG